MHQTRRKRPGSGLVLSQYEHFGIDMSTTIISILFDTFQIKENAKYVIIDFISLENMSYNYA